MMKQKLGFLVLGAATLACSGRYYEVGEMDGVAGVGGNRGSAGGSAPGGNPSAGPGDSTEPGVGAGAGVGNAGPSTPAGGLCVPAGAPPALTGPFADSTTVWRRIATLISGPPFSAPTKPPIAATTYAWAGDEVSVQFEAAKGGEVAGVELFLRQALGLEADAPLEGHWGVVATQSTLLNGLLRMPLDEDGRVGIFTEPSWLALHTTISSRGAIIEEVLFGSPIPPPPEGVQNPGPDPNLTDRENIEAAATVNVACVSCHSRMDPVGFALGHFAADGSYRELDKGRPIDTTGSRRSGMYPEEIVEFDGIADFGQKFEGNCAALQGIAASFLRAALIINEAQGSELYDENVARVQQAFVNSDRTYEDLVRAYIQSPAGLMP